MSGSCVWECLKEFLGYFGALLLIGVLAAAIAGYIAASGGTGAVTLAAVVEGAFATGAGVAALKAAGVGLGGVIGSIIGCIAAC